jgi:hypothetical protein
MDATLWTGDGSTSPRSITNTTGFQPDLVWTKDRTSAYNHQLFDSVRGTGSSKNLMSNTTDAEGVNASSFGYLSGFNSNGFALTKGSDPGNEYLWVGKTSDNYVAWQWQAGQGTTSSNTNGAITSTVSVNATAGFSVVSYSGTSATTSTIGHGLGVAPQFIIVKSRTTTDGWVVYHTSVGNGSALNLNTTGASNSSNTYWNNTTPTSSVFSIGNSTGVNQSGATYIAYCWAQVAGFSQFGSYTGNGSTDGPFIYLGFRPKFILVKRTDTTDDWVLIDSARDPYNADTHSLFPDLSNAEGTAVTVEDMLSNGFKCRSTAQNVSGGTYIYMAFAENPFKYANAR